MTRDDQKAAAEAPIQTVGEGQLHGSGRDKRVAGAGCADGPPGRAAADQATAEEIVADALRELSFTVNVSLRYHSQRRGWFDALHRVTMVLSAVGGSAALSSVLTAGQDSPGSKSLVLIIALIVTLAGALNVAFGFSERARTANDLYRRFALLAHQMAAHAAPGAAELRAWTAERLMIEADEPPVISVLNVLCHNAEAVARGYGDDQRYRVRWWQRLFANLISLPPTDWRALA